MKIYNKGNHTIIHADVLEALNSDSIKEKSVDLIFIDPPYNIGKDFNGISDKWETSDQYLNWCFKWLELCVNKLKDNGSMYVMTSTQYMPYLDIFLREKLRIHIVSRIIWHYDSSGVQAQKHFGSLYEPILHCVKTKTNYTFNSDEVLIDTKTAKRNLIDYRSNPPKAYNSKKIPGNVWEFNRVRYKMEEYEDHPTQKPTKLLERILKASSNQEDLILDVFGGTFTTAFVAKQLKRKSITIELNEEYLKVGLRRLNIQETFNNKELKAIVKKHERVNFMTDKERKMLLEEEKSRY